MTKSVEEEIALLLPKQEQYLFTQIFQMPDIDSFTQRTFASDYQRYQKWKSDMIRFNTEFGIILRKHDENAPRKKKQDLQDISMDSDQIEDLLFTNKRILLKILRFRSKTREEFDAEEFKQRSIKSMEKSG